MESLIKRASVIQTLLMTQSTAADLWWIAITIVIGMGGHVGWWMWAMAGIETFTAVAHLSKIRRLIK